MLRQIVTRLYRERRRAAIVAMLCAAIGASQFLHAAPDTAQSPSWGLIAAAMAMMTALLFPVIVVLAALLGPLRNGLEVLTLILAVSVWLPLTGLVPIPDQGSFVFLPTLWSAGLFLSIFYATGVFDHWLPVRRVTIRSRARSRLAPDALFPGLALTPETAQRCGDDRLVGVDWVEPGHLMRIETRFDDIATVTELQTIEALEPGHLFRVRFQGEPVRQRAQGTRGILQYRLRPTRRGTRVEGERVYENGSRMRQIAAWIDDSFGRFDDRCITDIERAAQT